MTAGQRKCCLENSHECLNNMKAKLSPVKVMGNAELRVLTNRQPTYSSTPARAAQRRT